MKPLLKSFSKLANDGEVLLIRELGVHMTIPDPDGQVLALLDLLDGTLTVAEMAQTLSLRWPDLTAEAVAEAIVGLDEAGLLEDGDARPELSHWQLERYTSNVAFFSTFASLGKSRYRFQEELTQAHVVLLGVGGLGSTLLYNLAGLGVGHVTLLDSDRVELKNLARQFLYSEAEVGQPKLGRALERARAFNSEMKLTAVERRVTGPADVAPLLHDADLVLCGIDTPTEVYDWVNEACITAGVPWIAGGMQVGRGLYYSVIPGESGCRACLNLWQRRQAGDGPQASAPERINRGMGPVATMMGSLVALEAVRYLTRFAPPVSAGKLWLVDFASGQADIGLEWPRLEDCPVCGHLTGVGKR